MGRLSTAGQNSFSTVSYVVLPQRQFHRPRLLSFWLLLLLSFSFSPLSLAQSVTASTSPTSLVSNTQVVSLSQTSSTTLPSDIGVSSASLSQNVTPTTSLVSQASETPITIPQPFDTAPLSL